MASSSVGKFTLGDAVLRLSTDSSAFVRGLSSAESSAEQSMKNMGQGAKKFGARMTAVGAAGVTAFATLANGAADFDTAMREVWTLMPDMSEEAFGSLKKDVRELAKEMGVDLIDATKATYQAISAGVPEDNVIDFLRTSAKGAIGGASELSTTVDGLTSVMNAYGKDSSQTEDVMNKMFQTMKGGKTTITELSDSIFNAAPIANAAGVSMEELLAQTQALTLSGTPTRVAMTQVRSSIQSLIKPNKEMSMGIQELAFWLYETGELSWEQIEPLQALGKRHAKLSIALAEGRISQGEFNKEMVSVNKGLEAAGGNMGKFMVETFGAQGTFELLRGELNLTDNEMAKMVGSVEGLQAVLGTTGDKSEVFKSAMQDMENSANATQTAFDTMAGGIGFKTKQAKAEIKDMAITIGDQVLPVFADMLEAALPIIDSLAKWIEKNPQLTRSLLVLSGILLVGGPLLFGLGQFLTLGGGIIAMLPKMIGLLGTLKGAAAAGGLAGIASTLVLIAGAGAIGWQFGSLLNDLTDKHFPGFANAIDDAFDALVKLINKFKEWIGLQDDAPQIGSRTQQLIDSGQVVVGADGTVTQNPLLRPPEIEPQFEGPPLPPNFTGSQPPSQSIVSPSYTIYQQPGQSAEELATAINMKLQGLVSP